MEQNKIRKFHMLNAYPKKLIQKRKEVDTTKI